MKTKILIAFLCCCQLVQANLSIQVTASDIQSWVDTAPFEGNVNEIYSGLIAGELDDEGLVQIGSDQIWDFSSEGLVSGVANFALPEIPEGMLLTNATLSWEVVIYNPALNPLLGNLELFHSQQTLLPGDNGGFIGIFAEPDATEGYIASVDVTQSIRSDYIFDITEPEADFQFIAEGIDFNDDGSVTAYLLPQGDHLAPRGDLTLEFSSVPESSNFALILGFLTFCSRAITSRRRSTHFTR